MGDAAPACVGIRPGIGEPAETGSGSGSVLLHAYGSLGLIGDIGTGEVAMGELAVGDVPRIRLGAAAPIMLPDAPLPPYAARRMR
mmetsp:Transcript_51397/g.132640  ORF Transcript_51397/g.132640 Transcript_51397/m.132640 type:complete len:85 (+) Transcript_51397:1015-1269(+)